jgi:plastocyanin
MRNSQFRRVGAVVAGCCAAALVMAGCGGGGGGGGASTFTVVAPSGGGTPSLTIEAHDIFFSPKTVKAPSGKLAIHYVEDGTQEHTLVIQGVNGFKLEVGPSKKSDAGTVDLQPGKYTFYCTEAGHRAQGMQGTITVAS